jgi:hypothetical protein
MDALLNCFAENNINISHVESFVTRGETMFEWMGSTFLVGEFADSFYIAEYIEGKEEYEMLAQGVEMGDIVRILETYQDQDQDQEGSQEELNCQDIARYIAMYLEPYKPIRDWTGYVDLTKDSAKDWGYPMLTGWGYEFLLAGRCFRIIYRRDSDSLELLERVPIENEEDTEDFDSVIIDHKRAQAMEEIAVYIEENII